MDNQMTAVPSAGLNRALEWIWRPGLALVRDFHLLDASMPRSPRPSPFLPVPVSANGLDPSSTARRLLDAFLSARKAETLKAYKTGATCERCSASVGIKMSA